MTKRGRQGEGGGRPPKYADAESLSKKVKLYLGRCIEDRSMPNKAGFCVFADISRDTYNEYKKKFPDAIKGFEARVEDAWVQRLGGNSPTGAIFYLKNAFKEDYREKQEVDHTTNGKDLPAPILSHALQLHDRNKEGQQPK